jgi:hypothetical protein
MARGGRGRVAGGAPPSDLFLLKNGVFTRSTEGQYWDGTTYYNEGINTPIVTQASPKEYYMTRSATNTATFNESFDNAVWAKIASASITPGQADGPDGSTLTADQFNYTGAGDYIKHDVTMADNQIVSGAVFARHTGAASSITIELVAKNGTLSSTTFALTSSWARYSVQATGLTGGTTPELRIKGTATGTSCLIWGAVHAVEISASQVTHIENDDAGGRARGIDALQYPSGDGVPEWVADGTAWTINVKPDFDDTQISTLAPAVLMAFNDGGDAYLAFVNSTGTKVRLKDAVTTLDTSAVTFSRDQALTIHVNLADGSLHLEGFTTGNGTYLASATITFPAATGLSLANTWTGTNNYKGRIQAPTKRDLKLYGVTGFVNGSDYYSSGTGTTAVLKSSPWTLACMFKAGAAPSGSLNVVAGRWSNGAPDGGACIHVSSALLMQGKSSDGTTVKNSATKLLEAGKVYFGVLTYDGANLHIYDEAGEIGVATAMASYQDPDGSSLATTVGVRSFGNTNFDDGTVYGWCSGTTALSAAQAAEWIKRCRAAGQAVDLPAGHQERYDVKDGLGTTPGGAPATWPGEDAVGLTLNETGALTLVEEVAVWG